MSYGKENIIDPALERVDPTPNIHDLFRQFNRRFFWGKLDMVEVTWSGRQMTSCAGLCQFRPRSGHCIIKLSAPLLSLRSRKDLVETLLHEMIHAFLFMTKNYKDRSDHGPEFHKHMNRINQETGTNISVYHTFNDEVRHYKNHVWRCNGPCQKMSPFFGFLRRATNRAPGPNDTWWQAHKLKCYGQFIKIEEPPGYKSKKNNKNVDAEQKNAKDIRNFFTPTPGSSNIHTLSSTGSYIPFGSNKGGALKNTGAGTIVNTGKPGSSNIHTLSNTGSYIPFGSNKGGALKNTGAGTILNTGKPTFGTPKPPTSIFPKTPTPNTHPSNLKATTSTPQKEPIPNQSTSSIGPKGISIQEVMRNVWSNKFPEKRKQPRESPNSCKKLIIECKDCPALITDGEQQSHQVICPGKKTRPCPVCNKPLQEGQLDEHLMVCLSDSITEDIFACDDVCDMGIDSGDVGNKQKVACPICGIAVGETDINIHIDECLTLQVLKEGL